MSAFYVDAATVPVREGRPLLAVDADEVIFRFAEGFERFLASQGCSLSLVNYRLHGNVRRADDGTALLDIEVTALLDEFRAELDWLEPVEGAAEALIAFAPACNIVVVSNVSPAQAPARLRNLSACGLDFPLLANDGPKGPAVKALAQRARAEAFFVDDVPLHHASVAEHASHVRRIHFVGDARLRPLAPPAAHAHLRAESWTEIETYVQAHLKRSQCA